MQCRGNRPYPSGRYRKVSQPKPPNTDNAPRIRGRKVDLIVTAAAFNDTNLPCRDSNFRIGDHPPITQRESNKSRRIDKMLATITNPFGPSA